MVNDWVDARQRAHRKLGSLALGHAGLVDQGSHLDRPGWSNARSCTQRQDAQPFKMCLLVVTMWALHLLGVWLINQPYDPTKRLLPEIYFSADWYWKPEAGPELKPRREVWGGLGLALLLSMLGLRILVGDRLAFRMASWGILGGAIGFPAGQSLQAYHAWHLPDFQTATWLPWDRVLNWWNIMETTYGFIMGGCLTLGVLLNRHLIAEDDASPNVEAAGNKLGSMPWPVALGLEGVLLSLHVALLVGSELIPQCGVGWYGNGLVMAAIPLVAVCAGRFWPYYLLLPVTIIPIAGKTFRETALTKFDGNMEVVKEAAVSMPVAVIAFLVVPIVLTWVLAGWWSRTQLQVRPAQHFAPVLLLAVTWLYFGLNFAFFQFPLPWLSWTARTPNAIFYFIAAVCLTILSTWPRSKRVKKLCSNQRMFEQNRFRCL